ARIAVLPFETIDERPVEIPAHVDASLDRLFHRVKMRTNVRRAYSIIVITDTVLGDDDGPTVFSGVLQREVHAFGINVPRVVRDRVSFRREAIRQRWVSEIAADEISPVVVDAHVVERADETRHMLAHVENTRHANVNEAGLERDRQGIV